MTRNLPIKRHKSLQHLSREHHDILAFGLRLKKGIAKQASRKIMNDYIVWFWDVYLEAHFKLEEEHLFPLLLHDKFISQALNEHLFLKALFTKTDLNVEEIISLYTNLELHIRFEERVLFNKMQEVLSEEQLHHFEQGHPQQKTCPLWTKIFWN